MIKKRIIKFISRAALSFLLFYLIALPFKRLAFLIPGVTEIRPENVIPPVAGILFGFPGALGAALGNVAGDMLNGTPPFTMAFGFTANFLYAYLAHRMWYTWFEKDGCVTLPRLTDYRAIFKFIWILFVDSVFVASMISLLVEGTSVTFASDVFLILFYNNFDFAVILGIPILSIVGLVWNDYEVPKKRELSATMTQLWTTLGVIPWAVVTITVGFIAISLSEGKDRVMNPTVAMAALCLSILLLLIYSLKPRTADVAEPKRSSVKVSLKARTAAVFLAIGFLIAAFSFASAYHLSQKNPTIDRLVLWTDVFSITGMSINVVFAIILFFLRFIERRVTEPIEKLFDIVGRFSNLDHLDHEGNEELRAECTGIKTKDEIEALARGVGDMIGSVEDYAENLKYATAESQRISTELSLAHSIQSGALPAVFPPFPGYTQFDLFASMKPAKEVGGDFYDFFLIDPDHLCLVIADVSGKGVGAALFMMNSKALIKFESRASFSPAAILAEVNRQICENNMADMFVTVWLGILEISTGRLTAANAGHEFPAVKKAGGSFELFKDRHGFVIGGMEGTKYRDYELELSPGDWIFVYTDGVAEATDAENELFGADRMLESLNSGSPAGCEELIENVRAGIDAFVKGAPQFDDITMLALKYNGRG